MDAVEFRVNNGAIEYRTLVFAVEYQRGDDCSHEWEVAVSNGDYSEWMPFPSARVGTSESLRSSYDCGAKRVRK
jgi:hypothetical protein